MNHSLRLVLVFIGLSLLTACEEPIDEQLNIVGSIDIGPMARNALLLEACIAEVPYYQIVTTARTGRPGTRGALALRLNEDGSVPACLPGRLEEGERKDIVVTIDTPLPPNLELGDLCINGVHYMLAISTYTLGLTPAYNRQGEVGVCR